MNANAITPQRVIGFDSHPDSFTAAVLRGPTPASAILEKTFNKMPMNRLSSWAKKNTLAEDLIVLEASGNSFDVVRRLAALGRRAKVLESCQLGKLKEAHANNDKISAVRIGKAYLAGTCSEVWVPDPLTQERRDWFHAYGKTVKRTTQMTNRIRSYLSDNGVRLEANLPIRGQEQLIGRARDWTPRQKQVLEGMMLELRHGHEQRDHWGSLMAQEVLADPMLLSLVRLCGIRDVIAFALGALIGDIERFESPKKLVAYVGLYPAFDQSGNGKWEGGVGGRGRRDLRNHLIEAAHAILRSGKQPLAKWGRKLLARKESRGLAAAAVARKLTVAIWYLMKGRWSAHEEMDRLLSAKVGKIITRVGATRLKKLGTTRRTLRREVTQRLKNGRQYRLEPGKKFTPKTRGAADNANKDMRLRKGVPFNTGATPPKKTPIALKRKI